MMRRALAGLLSLTLAVSPVAASPQHGATAPDTPAAGLPAALPPAAAGLGPALGAAKVEASNAASPPQAAAALAAEADADARLAAAPPFYPAMGFWPGPLPLSPADRGADRREPDESSAQWSEWLGERPAGAADAAPDAAAAAASAPSPPRAWLSRATRSFAASARLRALGEPQLRPIVKKYDLPLAGLLGIDIVKGLGQFGQIFLSGLMTNAAVVSKDPNLFLVLFLSFWASDLALRGLGILRDKAANWLRESLKHDVRAEMVKKLAGRDQEFSAAHPLSEQSTRLVTDVEQVTQRNLDSRISLPYQIFMAAMGTGSLLYSAWQLGAASFGGGLPTMSAVAAVATFLAVGTIWMFKRYGHKQHANESARTDARALAAKTAEERLGAFNEAKRLGPAAVERLMQGFERASDALRGKAYRIQKTATHNDYATDYFGYFQTYFLPTGIGLWCYAFFGFPLPGDVAAFSGLAEQFRNALKDLLTANVKDYRVAEGQTKTVMAWLSAARPAAPAVEPDPRQRLAGALGVELEPGARVGVLEASGGSLEAVAAGLEGPGAAAFDAKTAWLPGTIKANLRDGRPGASDLELGAALQRADSDFLLEPGALDLDVAEATKRYGEGAMRRALLARLILQQPKVVVVSQPGGQLSGRDLEQFNEALGRVLKGRTAVWLQPSAEKQADLDRVLTVPARP